MVMLLGVLTWFNGFPEYQDCLEDSNVDNGECLKKFLMMSPPVKDVKDLEDACNKTDTGCLTEIGKKVVEAKITE